jgi:hypothetical protein
MDEEKELPEPWHWTNEDLSSNLEWETGPKHILYGKKTKTVARRQDIDDVLFRLKDSESQYAVVHLTWSSQDPAIGTWPVTQLYKDWEDVYFNRILKDSEEFD